MSIESKEYIGLIDEIVIKESLIVEKREAKLEERGGFKAGVVLKGVK
ncbi:hypothetical protein H7E67_18210 [Clostridium gasigenes]|nr:hypothetical protein [Clostridium gasigenes]MBB6625351.1 hypothetical protein [Clostridium gasigenes]MBU3089987.1 hypothetical protein [Clostridium gasigenes]